MCEDDKDIFHADNQGQDHPSHQKTLGDKDWVVFIFIRLFEAEG